MNKGPMRGYPREVIRVFKDVSLEKFELIQVFVEEQEETNLVIYVNMIDGFVTIAKLDEGFDDGNAPQPDFEAIVKRDGGGNKIGGGRLVVYVDNK